MISNTFAKHYVTLIKNVAYLAVSGVEYEERMKDILSKARGHLCQGATDENGAYARVLEEALSAELRNRHVQHPKYAEALQYAIKVARQDAERFIPEEKMALEPAVEK